MDYQDPLLQPILKAVRGIRPNLPVLFLTGHSHRRGWADLDRGAGSLEADCFGSTVGFASFNTTVLGPTGSVRFFHDFIDMNTAELEGLVAPAPLGTPAGEALSKRSK